MVSFRNAYVGSFYIFVYALTVNSRQNNVEELYSLFKFLRIKPLNNWSQFNEKIAKPIKSGRGGIRAMRRLQVRPSVSVYDRC